MTLKLQLFREGLSEKVHATNPKGIVGGFEFTVLQRNLKELARKAMKMCLRVLTERNKVGSTATVVRNSISIISHITFRDCRVHIMRSFAQEKKSQQAPEIDALVSDRKVFAWCHKIN